MNTQICFLYFYGPRLNCFRPFLSNNSITWRLQEYSDTTQVGALLTEFCEELVQADLLESYDSSSITGGSYSGHSYATINAVLKASSSESPDYTQILTNINTNLTSLNDKFVVNASSGSISICKALLNLFCVFSTESPLSNTSSISGNNYIRKLLQILCSDINSHNTTSYIRRILLALCGTFDNVIDDGVTNKLQSIVNSLKQSVPPNASITDVISALNATIDSKQDTTIVNNEVTPLAEINIDVPFEVKNLKKSDVENL